MINVLFPRADNSGRSTHAHTCMQNLHTTCITHAACTVWTCIPTLGSPLSSTQPAHWEKEKNKLCSYRFQLYFFPKVHVWFLIMYCIFICVGERLQQTRFAFVVVTYVSLWVAVEHKVKLHKNAGPGARARRRVIFPLRFSHGRQRSIGTEESSRQRPPMAAVQLQRRGDMRREITYK